MAKRKPKKRGGVNDSAACLTAVFLCLMGLGIAATMDHPECTKGQCVRTPAEQRAAAAKPVVLYRDAGDASFMRAMHVVAKNEGGYTPKDGHTNHPALYGINRKWHAGAFDRAKEYTHAHGEAAGKAYAASYYKREFWDRYRIDELPASTHAVVLDGVVNHRSEFARRLVAEARAGTTADKLLLMRWQEYQRLAEAAPEKYAASLPGWKNRLIVAAKASFTTTEG